MIPVDQTIFEFGTGDCMRACIASIFELDIETVPNFMQDGNAKFNEYLNNWCESRFLRAIDITTDDLKILQDCYVIACGDSPRAKNGERHAVVWLNEQIVFDPHPHRTGLNGPPTTYTIFVILDPKKFFNFSNF